MAWKAERKRRKLAGKKRMARAATAVFLRFFARV